MWLSQLNTLSVASFHKKLCSNLSDYVGLESSRNDCFSIVESSSSNVKSDSIGDSDRVAAELLCLCGIFFLLLHQAYQSSLPKVLTLNQPVWCQRSIKLMMP